MAIKTLCKKCNGTGTVAKKFLFFNRSKGECPYCKGEGTLDRKHLSHPQYH